jgi:hypothetical protein
MKDTAEFFKRLAKRHRELARGLQNEEFKGALLHLAEECEAKAEAQERRDREAGRRKVTS